MSRRRQRRVRLVWLILFALLFQQLALAAHACDWQAPVATTTTTESALTGGAAHCEHGGDDRQTVPADPVCAKHCLPDRAMGVDDAAAKLPPMLLPRTTFALAASCAALNAPLRPVAPTTVDPPPTRRSCALLI